MQSNNERIKIEILNLLCKLDFNEGVKDNTEKIKTEVIEILKDQVNDAKDFINNMKEEGLTVSSIEGEGFLRGCLTCLHRIESCI